jgi:hypothetical protein
VITENKVRQAVSYVLLDRDHADDVTLSPTAIRAIGAVVRDENGLALIRLKPVASAASA